MNTAEYVANRIPILKKLHPLSRVAWEVALLCVGWAYVFGARGEYCSPANRRSYYNKKGDAHPTIKTACKNFDGTGSCSGCKWYPTLKRTRFFDCRGFTYWILLQVFGWKLMGAGATSQWNNKDNWKAQGEVSDGIPQDTIVCLFYYKKDSKGKRTKTLAHTGLYYNGETVECSNGVQHSKTLNKKWDVWGVPACVDESVSIPDQYTPPILKRGSKGKWVTLLQTKLIQHGYSCGSTGADGDFGKNTEAAVKAFQRDNGLKDDGIVGSDTFNALDAPAKQYTVTIPHLSISKANTLVSQYPGSTKTEERG